MRQHAIDRRVRILAAALALCAGIAVRADLVSDLESAPWIGDGRSLLPEEGRENPAPEFVATFRRSAVAFSGRDMLFHIVCAGSYSLSVNGHRIETLTGTSLMPLFSPFGSTIYADIVRIPAEFLKADDGERCEVCVLLGNGWYGADASPAGIGFPAGFPRGRPCFKFIAEGLGELEWRWRRSAVLANSIAKGTVVDASREADKVLKRATFVKGPQGRIVARKSPAVVVGETAAGFSKWLREGEVQVVDFGECRTGYPKFVFKGASRGRKIEIVYGERLKRNGSVDPLPAHAAPRDEYVCCDGRNEFTPPFVWRSARYAEVRGVPTLLGRGDAAWCRIQPEFERTAAAEGLLAAKGKAVMDLHEKCVLSLLNHLPGFLVDDPVWGRFQRGSTVAAVAEALAQDFDAREFFFKTLRDFADESARDGWIPESAPFVGGAASSPGGERGGSFESACAVPVLMDALFRHYNDMRALEFMPVCLKYIDVVSSKYPTGVEGGVSATAHWYRFLRLSEKLASLSPDGLDRVSDIGSLADETAARFAEKWISDEGKVGGGTVQEQAVALECGLVPSRLVAAAEERLLAALEADSFKVPRSPLDARRVLLYLSSHTMDEAAARLAAKMQAGCESSPVTAAALDEWAVRHARCGL